MNIAIAGFRHGHALGLHNEAMESEKINLLGCFEEDDEQREILKNTKGIKFNYKTYEEILSDSNVEIVAIADYFTKRGKMVIEALRAGKHVVCDKPICTELSELDEIAKISKEKNLKVGCMLSLRFSLPLKTAHDIINSGEIGKVKAISFTGQHFLNFENREKWFFENGKHGGTINDIAIHGIDAVRFVTGKDLTKVNCAKTWNAFAEKTPDFCDSSQFMAEMDDIAVWGDVSYSAPAYKGTLPTFWNFHFWGTEGMMNFNLKERKIHIFKGEERIIEEEIKPKGCISDLIDEINGKESVLVTEETLKSQRQALIIQKAAEIHRN